MYITSTDNGRFHSPKNLNSVFIWGYGADGKSFWSFFKIKIFTATAQLKSAHLILRV